MQSICFHSRCGNLMAKFSSFNSLSIPVIEIPAFNTSILMKQLSILFRDSERHAWMPRVANSKQPPVKQPPANSLLSADTLNKASAHTGHGPPDRSLGRMTSSNPRGYLMTSLCRRVM